LKHKRQKLPATPSLALPPQQPAAALLFPVGVLFILVGLIASLMLTLDHFGAMSLPGCGPGSPCAAAANSVWGKLLGIPVSFIGVAHFLALLTIWLLTKGKPSKPILWAMSLAAAASLIYAGIGLGANLVCMYCMAIHAANIAILLTMIRGGNRESKGWPRQAIIGVVAATFAFALLLPSDAIRKRTVREQAQTQSAESIKAMVAQAQKNPVPPPTSAPPPVASSNPAPTPPAAEMPDSSVPKPPAALLGRYRFGPEKAAVRIVMFTDYQCPDCFKIEQELKALMDATPNLSVGIKYFPLSTGCNPQMNGQNLHPNACWAARAAETAGMLRGNDGFWEMHHALFARKGSFTDAELATLLASLGYDRAPFEKIMQGSETAARVKADVDEGISLGLYFTPMIFINGIELKGWNAPNALTRAVQAVLAANPSPAAPEVDLPPDARARYFADWREQPVMSIPAAVMRHTLGPADAAVTVVLFGDLAEKNTQEADGVLRLFTQGAKPNIRYTFAHFPVNKECNPSTQMATSAQGCTAARAVEAAEALGGPEAYWIVHNYVMSHLGELDEAHLRDAAAEAGLPPNDFLDAMKQPFVSDAIAADGRAAISLGIKSIPMIFIAGKLVPRWKLNNENLLVGMIYDDAEQP